MSASRAKKVKMATKSCPECDQQVPVACKSCPCGYIFISRKLLNAKHPEKSPPSTENKHEAKRRRTERARREKMHPTGHKDLENRKRSRSNSHSDHSRRGRGRPKSASAKKHEEERECVDTFFGIASAKPQTAVDSREHSEASEGPVTASCVTAPAPAWGAQLWAGLFWGLLGSQGALSVFCVWDVSKCIYKKTKQKAG
ncbi:UPF0547 protein C16orf87 homolog isoform X1 [Myotis daubentonii]|uniref:UPF0547 protein C16orf87 homolog isoform X1 n=1 Tax=Myotis daubentonii TaxID=98922 RepID=UPI002873AFC8|nr:UPF0547 protein C16orf87 homolog isoform X1 [Myotis daubentonii]